MPIQQLNVSSVPTAHPKSNAPGSAHQRRDQAAFRGADAVGALGEHMKHGEGAAAHLLRREQVKLVWRMTAWSELAKPVTLSSPNDSQKFSRQREAANRQRVSEERPEGEHPLVLTSPNSSSVTVPIMPPIAGAEDSMPKPAGPTNRISLAKTGRRGENSRRR